jgi:hypothetical protein
LRAIALLFLFALPFVGYAQGENFGKKEGQILAMGQQGWNDFYRLKAGDSTASMTYGNQLFGDAARHRNERLVKHANQPVQARVEKLRDLMTKYASAAVEIGRNLDGGGTMWTPIAAKIEADTELVLYGFLGGKEARAKHVVVSTVSTGLDTLSKTVASTHADKEATFFRYDDARRDLTQVRGAFTQLVLLAKHLSRSKSDAVLGFCAEYAKMANGDWG